MTDEKPPNLPEPPLGDPPGQQNVPGQPQPPFQPQLQQAVQPQLLLPPGITAAQAGFPVAIQQVQIWQGQFPPPEAIARYEEVMPGAFNRLMVMAEKQQDASIAATTEARRAVIADTRRGHRLGFTVTLLAMVGAGGCAYLGQPWVAVTFLGVPVLSVANALINTAKAKPPTVAPVAAAPPPASPPPLPPAPTTPQG